MANNKPIPATVAGNLNSIGKYTEQAIRYTTDPRTGAQTVRTFHGPYQAVLNLVAGLQNNGWATDLHYKAGPVWELTATIGLSWSNNQILDNPVDLWELTSNRVEKDFLNAQNSLVASLSTTDIQILQNFLDNPPFPIPTTPPVSASGAALSGNGLIAYNLVLSGVKSQAIFQPVLKHTQTTSNIYAVAASVANVGMLLKTSTLAAVLPNALAFTMPADPAFGKTGFAYGWLVDAPNVRVSAFNKTQIEQVFEFGLWSTAMYNAPI